MLIGGLDFGDRATRLDAVLLARLGQCYRLKGTPEFLEAAFRSGLGQDSMSLDTLKHVGNLLRLIFKDDNVRRNKYNVSVKLCGENAQVCRRAIETARARGLMGKVAPEWLSGLMNLEMTLLDLVAPMVNHRQAWDDGNVRFLYVAFKRQDTLNGHLLSGIIKTLVSLHEQYEYNADRCREYQASPEKFETEAKPEEPAPAVAVEVAEPAIEPEAALAAAEEPAPVTVATPADALADAFARMLEERLAQGPIVPATPEPVPDRLRLIGMDLTAGFAGAPPQFQAVWEVAPADPAEVLTHLEAEPVAIIDPPAAITAPTLEEEARDLAEVLGWTYEETLALLQDEERTMALLGGDDAPATPATITGFALREDVDHA